MLTWAPVEITNFCYVIGVTKESFVWFLYSTKMEGFRTENSMKSLSANACGYLKFITMVRSLQKRYKKFAQAMFMQVLRIFHARSRSCC